MKTNMAASKKKPIKKPVKKLVKKVLKKSLPKRAVKKFASKKVVKKILKKIAKKPTRKLVVKTRVKIKKVTRKKPAPLRIKKKFPLLFEKFKGNPIMQPTKDLLWQSEAVFNPAAVVHDGKIHLFYRALGSDGISRIGYTSSVDGIHFEDNLPYPVYAAENAQEAKKHHPFTSPARLEYNPSLYASGGGWGGCEDPRAVKIDDSIYLTFNLFNGWDCLRVAVTAISGNDLSNKIWDWKKFSYLSHPGDRQKNWVLFPEKINGKFAIFHNLDKGNPAEVYIAYVDELDMSQTPSQKETVDPHVLPNHEVAWHYRTRSACAPPLKTKDGWLLFYHAMDKNDQGRYKVGALLLDLKDPTKVLYRSRFPVLEPDEWYENDWKPGIVYVSGAVVKDRTLFLYYGGGDKHIAVAYTNLDEFLRKLKNGENGVLTKRSILKA